MKSARPFVLLALAVLLAPQADASRTAVGGLSTNTSEAPTWAARTALSPLVADPVPGPRADAELELAPRLDLGDVVLEPAADDRAPAPAFHLGAVELLADEPPRGPPASYPETRVGGFELSGPFRVGASPSLSLWSRQPCGFSCPEIVSDSPQDPWGLAIWTSEQIADRYYAESKRYGALTAIRNEALRRGLNAEQDAQGVAGKPWWKRGLSAVGGLFGRAKAADQRIESAVGEAARDLTRNVVPPSTAPVDRAHRIPTEYGGGPTQSDRIASAANGLSETAGDVAEGGARGGYQAGRDWFLVSGLGTVLNEARAARAATRELPTLEIDYRRYPDLAENIWHAQKAGRPDVLTHGGIPRVNRAAATKPVPNLSPWSRDEYPFASSLEGGEGAWVGHIPVEQQNAQGALIKNFVTSNGLRPGEQYRVLVTNHPFGE